jgi:hypothetical protein
VKFSKEQQQGNTFSFYLFFREIMIHTRHVFLSLFQQMISLSDFQNNVTGSENMNDNVIRE